MRFLCLHGTGSNSKVLQIQIASLRYELGAEHAYDLVEGIIPCAMAPDVQALTTAVNDSHTYYTYFDTQPSSLALALDALATYIEAEGPFAGVIGFSQGTSLAATLIAQSKSSGKAAPFQFAVFLSGIGAFDPEALLAENQMRQFDALPDTWPLDIPTVHIWGANDTLWKAQAELLRDLCWPGNRFEYVHRAGHAVPKGRRDVVEMAKVVRRAIDEAGVVDV